MTDSKIFKYYKIAAVLTLLSSGAFIVLTANKTFNERLWIALLINIGFHGLYFFISRAPLGQLERLKRNAHIFNKIAPLMINFFALWAIFASIAGTAMLIFSAIKDNQYEQIIVICVFSGLFLGGCSLIINLNKE